MKPRVWLRTKIQVCVVALLLCGIAFSGEPKSVLFVGNSFTFHNDLPGVFSRLAKANGKETQVRKATQSGYSLHQHSTQAKTLAAISSQKWDVVILQGLSVEPIIAQEKMVAATKVLVEKCGDARCILFMTWAYKSKNPLGRKLIGSPLTPDDVFPKMQQLLEDGYRDAAQAAHIDVAPVGLAWAAARKAHPEWELYKGDQYHSSMTGTCLTAVVFYRAIYGELPTRFPEEKAVDRTIYSQMVDAVETVPAKDDSNKRQQ